MVIAWVAGADLAVPVVAETDAVELRVVACDILRGCFLGVLSGLDGILLGGESIGVIAHGVEHIEAVEAFVARENVAGDVA